MSSPILLGKPSAKCYINKICSHSINRSRRMMKVRVRANGSSDLKIFVNPIGTANSFVRQPAKSNKCWVH
jgi:hypothetical protein